MSDEKKTAFEQVGEFHSAFKHPMRTNPTNPETTNDHRLRMLLMLEELEEVFSCMLKPSAFKICEIIKTQLYLARNLIEIVPDEAFREIDLEHLAKELSDLSYVVNGTAHVFGIDLDKATTEVHRSNMSKLGDGGVPVYNEAGKVMKSENYEEADMSIIWNKEEEVREV